MADDSTLIVGAVAAEVSRLRRRLGLRAVADETGVRTWADRGDQPRTILAITGMGAERAATALATLLDRHRPSAVRLIGFAGGLSPTLRAGDLVRPTEVIDAESGDVYRAEGGDRQGGRLVTVHRAASDPASKAALRERHGAAAVDMETAAAARVCAERGVPWQALRAITDAADQTLASDLAGLVAPDGRPSIVAAAGYVMRRPGRLSGLLGTARRARRAAKALADAIVDELPGH